MSNSEKFDVRRRQVAGRAISAPNAESLGITAPSPSSPLSGGQERSVDISFLQIDDSLTLRRMVVRTPSPKGTVLLLHGFPETLYAWKDIAIALADDYEVHAFDWPGYGLSSRPSAARFSYAPREYARVLDEYISKTEIDTSTLTIYATDIGSLPVLLLALDKSDIAKKVIVGDFAPFDRPGYMYDSLQKLKAGPAMDQVRAFMNKNREEILRNTFTRGLAEEARFQISEDFREDAATAWGYSEITTADAFAHYYSQFTRDQNFFESQLARLDTPLKVLWGEKDLYIGKEAGTEFANRVHAVLTILPGIGHYPHLQDPERTVEEIRASFR